MAKLPWASELYGLFEATNQNEVNHLYRLNGSFFGSVPYVYKPWYATRSGYSKNPVRMLSLFTPWRDPSSYSRLVIRRETITRGNFRVWGGTYKVLNGTISPYNVSAFCSVANRNPCFSGTAFVPDSAKADVKNGRRKAITKALLDLADAKSNIGANVAELSKTANSLAFVAKECIPILRALRGLRRGRLPQIPQLNAALLKRMVRNGWIDKRLANYWLTYWYGFKPLYQDGKGLVELLNEQFKESLLFHGRGRSSVAGADSFPATGTLPYDCPAMQLTERWDVRWICNLTGKIRPYGEISRALNRAGLANPGAVLWEVIPFSFVLDWVVPVGETLQALSAPLGLDFVGGHITTRYEREMWGQPTSWSVLDGGSAQAQSTVRGFGFTREKLATFPAPEFYTKTFFSGASRWATIAALITQATRR